MFGKCNYFLFSKNLDTVVNKKNVELNKSDIYVFPEIQNIVCLGKLEIWKILILHIMELFIRIQNL